MTTKNKALGLALAVAAIGWSGMAKAEHFEHKDHPAGHIRGDCADQFNDLEDQIIHSEFIGAKATSDQGNLLIKVDSAAAKVAQQKYGEAVDKLEQISDKATSELAGAAKPKLTSASAINSAVATAIGCITLLVQ